MDRNATIYIDAPATGFRGTGRYVHHEPIDLSEGDVDSEPVFLLEGIAGEPSTALTAHWNDQRGGYWFLASELVWKH